MQIKPTLDHIPVFELSEFDLPEIQTNNTLEYGENPVSKASVLRKEITNVSDEFLQRWHEHGDTLEKFIKDPQLQKNNLEMGAMWFGRNQKFRWNHSDSPRVLQDLPGFNMDPHLDNRAVFGVVIVNLKDNPAGSGTTILDQFRKKQIYQGPTEKGTGILLFNNWNTWHMIANNSEEDRLVSYYTLSIDHMNIDN
jgi:hypothetical protein